MAAVVSMVGRYWMDPAMWNTGRYIIMTMVPTRIPMASRSTGAIHVHARSLCCARDDGRNTRMKSSHPLYARLPHDRGIRFPLRGSRNNPLIVLGGMIDSTGCCARRVLVQVEHSPPVHQPDSWRTGLALGTAV